MRPRFSLAIRLSVEPWNHQHSHSQVLRSRGSLWSGQPMRSLVLIAIVVTSAFGAAGVRAAGVAAPCRGTQLTGRFAVVAGSAGAGNIGYALVLRNRSASTCTVTGVRDVALRGRAGKRLATHVQAAFPGALTAILVTLAPGQATRATA